MWPQRLMTISTVESVCRFSQQPAEAPDVALAEERADHDGWDAVGVLLDRDRADHDVGRDAVGPALEGGLRDHSRYIDLRKDRQQSRNEDPRRRHPGRADDGEIGRASCRERV